MLQGIAECPSFLEYSIVSVYHILFVRSYIPGHEDCSHLLWNTGSNGFVNTPSIVAVMNRVAMNIGVQMSEFLLSILLGVYPEV